MYEQNIRFQNIGSRRVITKKTEKFELLFKFHGNRIESGYYGQKIIHLIIIGKFMENVRKTIGGFKAIFT